MATSTRTRHRRVVTIPIAALVALMSFMLLVGALASTALADLHLPSSPIGQPPVMSRVQATPTSYVPVRPASQLSRHAVYDRAAPARQYFGECYTEAGAPPYSVMKSENVTGRANQRNTQGPGGSPASTASGCFQIVDGTWDGYGGYASAGDAPVPVQVAKAKLLMRDRMGICHWSATSPRC